MLAIHVSPFVAWHIVCLTEDENAMLNIQDGFCGNPQDLFSRAVPQLLASLY